MHIKYMPRTPRLTEEQKKWLDIYHDKVFFRQKGEKREYAQVRDIKGSIRTIWQQNLLSSQALSLSLFFT
jgi:hypothetical protein